MTKDRLIGVRDPHGFRPLALGRLGDAWVICSETCAMDLIGATYVRDVEPGEMVVISARTAYGRSSRSPPAPHAQCVFEHVYFSRPDSYVFGESVNEVRTEFGRVAGAREPRRRRRRRAGSGLRRVRRRSAMPKQSGIPMRMGLIRNHYVGRTFIQPQQSIRHFGVRVKLNPVRSILEGKRVVLVDDSHRARDHQPQDRQHGARRRRDGSAHAHQLSADDLALLLRRGHAARDRS